MIEVEKGVPLPDIYNRTSQGRPRFPFKALVVGDSFFVPYDNVYEGIARMTSLKRYYEKLLSTKYACRKVDGGVRVWRIK